MLENSASSLGSPQHNNKAISESKIIYPFKVTGLLIGDWYKAEGMRKIISFTFKINSITQKRNLKYLQSAALLLLMQT